MSLSLIHIGQSKVSVTCPVCEHTPVTPEDCKPYKSLRTTIRVFLRTEEKKRDATRLKAQNDILPVTLGELGDLEHVNIVDPTDAWQKVDACTSAEDVVSVHVTSEESSPNLVSTDEEKNVPQQSVEVCTIHANPWL